MIKLVFVLLISISSLANAQIVDREFITRYETTQRVGSNDLQRLPAGTRVTALQWSADKQWVWTNVSLNGASAVSGWVWVHHLSRLYRSEPSRSSGNSDRPYFRNRDDYYSEPTRHSTNTDSSTRIWQGHEGTTIFQSGGSATDAYGNFYIPIGSGAWLSSSGNIVYGTDSTMIGN